MATINETALYSSSLREVAPDLSSSELSSNGNSILTMKIIVGLLASSFSYLLSNPFLLSAILVGLTCYKIRSSIMKPLKYKLDMRQKVFCKPMAEIDNSLPIHKDKQSKMTRRKSNSQQEALDCSEERTIVGEPCERANHSNDQSDISTNDINSEQQESDNDDTYIYPNGWLPVIESSKVKPGSVRKAIICGRDVVVTRSRDNKEVSVLDAYCPHMGVHLGVAGQIKLVNQQSCVECPFHGWSFRTSDGKCVDIPYMKQKSMIPPQAHLKVWPSAEVDNFIYIWYHRDNEPPRDDMIPTKQLPPGWKLVGRTCHFANLELRDVMENGADMNHFEGIHNDLFIFGSDINSIKAIKFIQKYARHHWDPDWKPRIDEFGKTTHIADMRLQSWATIFGFRLFDITINAVQIGPARVNLRYDSDWYGSGLLIMNAIPIGGRQTKYVQHMYTVPTLRQFFMAKWVLYGEIFQLERDFFIWNHKKNIRNPIFVAEDKVLKQFRSWYSRKFYKRKRHITIKDFKLEDKTKQDNVVTRQPRDLDF